MTTKNNIEALLDKYVKNIDPTLAEKVENQDFEKTPCVLEIKEEIYVGMIHLIPSTEEFQFFLDHKDILERFEIIRDFMNYSLKSQQDNNPHSPIIHNFILSLEKKIKEFKTPTS